jgi:hypothetical protein
MTIRTDRPGCLAALLSFLRLTPKTQAQPQPLPYRTRDDFLSPAEASLFRLISSHLQGRAMVFPKVRLADIFFVARPNENMSYINRVAQRHLDFLVCDATSLRPLAGIELDDASHARPQRQDSDRFLNEVFSSAELPLIRIPAQRSYTAEEVASFLGGISPTPSTVAKPAPADAPSPPVCPKCGIPMVVRQVAQGQHKGKRFYGCRNFPQCRQVIAIDR